VHVFIPRQEISGKPNCYISILKFALLYRRRRLEFAGFHLENLQKYPKNPVNPV
jgi:hypothetical protein